MTWCTGATAVAPREKSGVKNIVQVQFFTDLLNPLLNALGGQFWLTVFIDGQKAMTLRGAGIAAEFKDIVQNYIEKRFGARSAAE